MDKQTKQILKDVYSIDKGLKAHEAALVKIIQELLRSKPESKIDENFVKELRAKLVERSRLLKEAEPHKNMLNTLFNRKLAYAFAGTALVVCAVVVITGFYLDKDGGQLVIREVKDNAFGTISYSQQTEEGGGEMLGGRGGGGPETTPSTQDIGMPSIYPYMVNYNYVYKGEEFDVSGGQVDVYKRIKGDSITKSLSNVLRNVNLSLVDFSKFKDARVNNIEVVEDRDFGYQIQISPRQNMISIYANWEKWPRESFAAPTKVPTDEHIISAANKFLSEYGISREGYGEPEVLESRTFGEAIPEYISAVYPIEIDGKVLYDQSGQKYGMTVTFNSTYDRIMSVYGINANTFESSKYAAEADKEKILEFAEQGGMIKSYINPNATETVNIGLGTPELGLVGIWQVSPENKADAKEIFVPSLIFPITEKPDSQYFYRTTVVVPLVGEVLNQQDVPMPEPRVLE